MEHGLMLLSGVLAVSSVIAAVVINARAARHEERLKTVLRDAYRLMGPLGRRAFGPDGALRSADVRVEAKALVDVYVLTKEIEKCLSSD